MDDHAGYRWSIQEGPDAWTWVIRSRGDDIALVTGTAVSRAHAAACVVRTLVQGVGPHRQSRPLAA